MTDQDLLRAIQNDDTQQMKIAALREELEAETERTGAPGGSQEKEIPGG
jgi:hypothetical protein